MFLFDIWLLALVKNRAKIIVFNTILSYWRQWLLRFHNLLMVSILSLQIIANYLLDSKLWIPLVLHFGVMLICESEIKVFSDVLLLPMNRVMQSLVHWQFDRSFVIFFVPVASLLWAKPFFNFLGFIVCLIYQLLRLELYKLVPVVCLQRLYRSLFLGQKLLVLLSESICFVCRE